MKSRKIKLIPPILAISVATGFALACSAAEYHVDNVTDLTNRVVNSKNGDVFYLAENVYDLTGVQVGTSESSHFYPTSGWTWRFRAEPGARRENVVLRANGRRIFYLSKGFLELTGLTLENGQSGAGSAVMLENTDDSGIAATNCIFRNNASTAANGVFNFCSRGAQSLVRKRLLHKCAFIGNSAATYYGVGTLNQAVVTDCVFTNNSAGTAYACFIGGTEVSKCEFVGNRGQYVFSHSMDDTVIRDTLFRDNTGPIIKATSHQLVVTNCIFDANAAPSTLLFEHAKDALTPQVYDSVISRNVSTNGNVASGSAHFLRCRFEGNEAQNSTCLNGGVYDSCLIISNKAAGSSNNSAFGTAVSLNNCTLIGNVKNDNRYRAIINTSSVAINTVFIGNIPEAYKNPSDSKGSYFYSTNCVWTAQNQTNAAFDTWMAQYSSNWRLIAPGKLKFSAELGEEYHPLYGSPLRDKGWCTDEYLNRFGGKDLDRNPRYMFKGIDVGCYECQKMPGLMLLVR